MDKKIKAELSDVLGDIREIEEGLKGIRELSENRDEDDDIYTLLKWACEKTSAVGNRFDHILMDAGSLEDKEN